MREKEVVVKILFFKCGREFEEHCGSRIKNYDYQILGIHFLKINTKLKCCSVSCRLLRHRLKRADPYNSRYSLGVPFSTEIALLPLSPPRKVPDTAQSAANGQDIKACCYTGDTPHPNVLYSETSTQDLSWWKL